MFCSNCGTQVQDNARFCYKCGSAITQNAQPSANTYQQPGVYEQPNVYQQPVQPQPTVSYSNTQVKDGVNVVFPDGHNEIGDIYISATEIVFIKKSKAVRAAFGFLGSAIENGQERFRINVSDIAGGCKTRIGINPNVYQITLRDGQIFKLCLNKPKTISYLQGRFG